MKGIIYQAVMGRGHEQVVFVNQPEFKLKAIIGVHNTVLGPALGGCRVRLYRDEDEALEDVLRLSEGMTYKNALADLPLGGGKACIIADPDLREGRKELFIKFAEAVESLSGKYITAEDMGTSVKDLSIIRTVTKHAAGYPLEDGGTGDPSPWTAKGVYNGILASAERIYGSKNLEGKKIVIQGVGNVGSYLLEALLRDGAKCFVSDVSQSALEKAVRTYGVEVISNDACYDFESDIFSPCAIGQIINPTTVPRLKCKIIAGGANNQLSSPDIGQTLKEMDILYAPDFVINAGGVISICSEYINGTFDSRWITLAVDNISKTINKVFDKAQSSNRSTEEIAVQLAKDKIASHKEEN